MVNKHELYAFNIFCVKIRWLLIGLKGLMFPKCLQSFRLRAFCPSGLGLLTNIKIFLSSSSPWVKLLTNSLKQCKKLTQKIQILREKKTKPNQVWNYFIENMESMTRNADVKRNPFIRRQQFIDMKRSPFMQRQNFMRDDKRSPFMQRQNFMESKRSPFMQRQSFMESKRSPFAQRLNFMG